MDYKELLINHVNLIGKIDDPIKLIIDEQNIFEWQESRQKDLLVNTQPIEWADIGVVFDDPYIVILRDLVEFPGGYRNGYIRIYNRAYLENGAAGIVTMPEKDGKILLMHNFRHSTRSWHWEIPRGFGEPGISAANQAKTELKEEIGVDAVELIDLGFYFSNTGLEGNPINLFLARITEEVVINPGIGVDTIRWVSIEELEKLISNSEITDGFTIAAYTRAKLKGIF
jgi:ADP-ribose pyrophosphatase